MTGASFDPFDGSSDGCTSVALGAGVPAAPVAPAAGTAAVGARAVAVGEEGAPVGADATCDGAAPWGAHAPSTSKATTRLDAAAANLLR